LHSGFSEEYSGSEEYGYKQCQQHLVLGLNKNFYHKQFFHFKAENRPR